MANTITLRAYLDELEHLLDTRSPTEVISHCRYILQHYPRNVEAYRLLGRALLERGEQDGVAEHYDEALQVFQRVLSVLPNDYMAHLGVSQIFQEKGDLERAIWHLERAYEQMPGNPALQEALRELYAQRSGSEEAPARLQLTRGALAHQYIRAQQYEQALVELRAVLSEEKNERLDLQVLLAEVLWNAGHAEEAAEQAARILEVLPDCLEANRILARYWLEHERPSDAQLFLERIEAVDPYEARRTLQPETEAPDPNRLPRLDYGTQAQAAASAETPDWVDELGDLSDFSMEQGSPFAAEPEAPSAPFEAESLFGAPFQADVPPAEPPADWMGEVESPSPSPFDAENWPEPEAPPMPPLPETDAEEALDLGMDWLAEAGAGTSEPETPAASIPDDAPLPPDWLDEAPEVETSADATLADVFGDEEVFAEEPPTVPVAESDWMAELGDAPHQVSSELPPPAEDAPSEPAATSADDDATWLFTLDEEEVAGAPSEAVDVEEAGEAPPTGFTGLLANIQSERAAQEALWGKDEDIVSEPDAEPEPEPPGWLSDFMEADAEQTVPAEAAAEQEGGAMTEESPAADLFELFESAEAEGVPQAAEADVAEEPSADEPLAPLDVPEWLTEPEYDFFAPEETVADAGDTVAPAEVETVPQDVADDWLDQLEEADESDLADVLLNAADEWQAAEAEGEPAELDWLGEASGVPADEDAVDALFAAVEEGPSAETVAAPSTAEPEEDWLAELPDDEETLLTTAEPEGETVGAFSADEDEVTLAEGEAAVESVLGTLEADVPTLEESVDEPVAFEAMEESLFGEGEKEAPTSLLSSLEEHVAQMTQAEESPAWLSGLETEASAGAPEPLPDEQTVQYRAAGQTGILQPDEAPAWMAAFTGEEVPAEPAPEAEDALFDTPETEVTPSSPQTAPPDEEAVAEAAKDLSTRILQPETPTSTDELGLFTEEPSVVSEVEDGLDTDELFAGVLSEVGAAAEEIETTEEGDLPPWLQAITQSEADKLDESLFEEFEAYSSSAEDSGILQPGQEDEWLQVLGSEEPTSEEPEAEETPAGEPSTEEMFSMAGGAEDDETMLDFLDMDAAAIAEMDFEDVAAELEEVVQPDSAGMSEGSEDVLPSAVAEAPDLSHTMSDETRMGAAHEKELPEVSATQEDDFSFDGMVPRWLRRPRENISGEAIDVMPENDSPPSSPEWLRDVSEDLDSQDQDNLQ